MIDDYGHHPVEIAAVLRAARQAYGGSGRVIAVMQPHRYTRLGALKNEFATCFVRRRRRADRRRLCRRRDADRRASTATCWWAWCAAPAIATSRRSAGRATCPGLIWQMARPGDVVVCLGAGNITAWAHALPGQLQQIAAEQAGPRAIANDPGP